MDGAVGVRCGLTDGRERQRLHGHPASENLKLLGAEQRG